VIYFNTKFYYKDNKHHKRIKIKMTNSEIIRTESGVVILVSRNILDNAAEVILRIEEHKNCLLHWGLRHHLYAPWQIPPQSVWPEGSHTFDNSAVQSPFIRRNGFSEIIIKLDFSMDFTLLDFVLFFPEEGRWDNNQGHNYRIEIPGHGQPAVHEKSPGDVDLDIIASAIIEEEMSRNSWTLMHRFNLCYELLDNIKDNLDGLALIFVWLRFSAIRQLVWQRNYNTKPKELGHAMDRLTLKLAGRYANKPAERELIRLIMTTLGRGSNAQRVRDEVLNIMHRHNIKEVSGHFMEEWHQKLHNNTTPDDIVICEAYLEFLRSNGKLNRFYKRLEEGGVTKKRLESYERPIKSHPDFIPHLKEALIHDFENFLKILKEVHSGSDLETAIHSSRYLFDAGMQSLVDFIWLHRNDRKMPLNTLLEKITESRRHLITQLNGPQYKVRDLLFLDIALEDFLRTRVELKLSSQLSGNQLAELVAIVLENLCLSNADEELTHCLHLWNRLSKMPSFEREWSLRAEAVLDRLRRALGSFIDRYYRLLQPRAEFLGRAFHADSWTINLFTEEVLRGRPAFVFSMLLRYLDPVLRKSANLGNWQIISRYHAMGEVQVASTLKSIQGKSFAQPVVIVTDSIAGDEEIPEGVAAIITTAVIDSLSHLAIRTRNAGILFATCYDSEIIEHIKSLKGHLLKLNVDNASNVAFEESHEEIGIIPQRIVPIRRTLSRPSFTVYAVPMDEFDEHNVGYKSNNLKRIRGKLPDWIGLPASVALPFGVFEKVLAGESNMEIAKKYEELTGRINDGAEQAEVLSELRKTVLTLKAPDELIKSLQKVMEQAGLAWPLNWDEAWMCIKHVWSSKWNDRAYLSREANGIPHDDLFMSVLIQRVVEADYSYVIHTVNPFTDNRHEIYAEVVHGLGETLAGNYPGRALSFTCLKGEQNPYLLSFSSKSVGLFGSGLIFRSDSNGEDLGHYAGAGLYDSFMLPPSHKFTLDYKDDVLVWDSRFRKDLLVTIARIGMIIEQISEFPQDIEGAYSNGQYYVVQSRPQVGTGNV
jgi:alpha-glucan,water dikinase